MKFLSTTPQTDPPEDLNVVKRQLQLDARDAARLNSEHSDLNFRLIALRKKPPKDADLLDTSPRSRRGKALQQTLATIVSEIPVLEQRLKQITEERDQLWAKCKKAQDILQAAKDRLDLDLRTRCAQAVDLAIKSEGVAARREAFLSGKAAYQRWVKGLVEVESELHRLDTATPPPAVASAQDRARQLLENPDAEIQAGIPKEDISARYRELRDQQRVLQNYLKLQDNKNNSLGAEYGNALSRELRPQVENVWRRLVVAMDEARHAMKETQALTACASAASSGFSVLANFATTEAEYFDGFVASLRNQGFSI